jgi:RNA polymerase sigma-70 factor (ECF subfamily)
MDKDAANTWKESFTGFYEKHSRSLWFYIYKICGDESMADDIFQESFYKYLKATPDILNEYQQKAFLYKIAYRLFIDQKRRLKFENEKFIPGAEAAEIGYVSDNERDVYMKMDMQKSFLLMKPKERSLLWLAYVEGYSHAEIAEITGDREKSIKVQLFRLKKKFAALLRKNGYKGEE